MMLDTRDPGEIDCFTYFCANWCYLLHLNYALILITTCSSTLALINNSTAAKTNYSNLSEVHSNK